MGAADMFMSVIINLQAPPTISVSNLMIVLLLQKRYISLRLFTPFKPQIEILELNHFHHKEGCCLLKKWGMKGVDPPLCLSHFRSVENKVGLTHQSTNWRRL